MLLLCSSLKAHKERTETRWASVFSLTVMEIRSQNDGFTKSWVNWEGFQISRTKNYSTKDVH